MHFNYGDFTVQRKLRFIGTVYEDIFAYCKFCMRNEIFNVALAEIDRASKISRLVEALLSFKKCGQSSRVKTSS